MFVNFVVPGDKNVVTKKNAKITNYFPLAKEIGKMNWESTKIVLLMVGFLDGWRVFLKDLGIPDVLWGMQAPTVIETTLITPPEDA